MLILGSCRGRCTARIGRVLTLLLLLAFAGGSFTSAAGVDAQTAASVADLKINFQDEVSVPPAGYLRDFGEPFGGRSGANQGSGLSYGWVDAGTSTPINLVGNGRNRSSSPSRGDTTDPRLLTFMHMQYSGTNGTVATGAWEIGVPDGAYTVTVSVGDATTIDSIHRIAIEGQVVINDFVPTATSKFATAARTVNVTDSRLTIDSIGGSNTKLNYVEIVAAAQTSNRPFVTAVTPNTGASGLSRQTFVSAEVRMPNIGFGVDEHSLSEATVRLIRLIDGKQVPANVNTSGGGDVIVLQPRELLDPNTAYSFQVTDGVKDLSGAAFLPFSSTFSTGGTGGNQFANIVFEQVALPTATGKPFTSVTFGPDKKLYAATFFGEIVRWSVNSDGTLGSAETISSLQTYTGTTVNRAIVGLVFDPAATASNPILWVSHGTSAINNAPDWSSKISRMSGANLQTVQDYVINLPRSIRDHLSNSLVWGPDGKLYLSQGSNSAMGAPDNAWGQRPERLLTGAILQINPAAITPPLDVKTEEGGTYNPYAANASVRLYATGVRNAFDLVWHSNGQLYVPTNSSAAGGATPSTPETTPPSCQQRMDIEGSGEFTMQQVGGIARVEKAQPDYLYRIASGGYYGHPNPSRCEWVLNGGNPTSALDPNEISQYQVTTEPDRNYRGPIFNFGDHYSPNGVIEYKSNVFNGALRNKLLVARYSGGDDIMALDLNGSPDYGVRGTITGLAGFTGFADPLDLVEDTVRNNGSGNLYVTEYLTQRIMLVRPKLDPTAYRPDAAVSASQLVFYTKGGSATQDLYISNNGSAALNVTLSKGGSDAARFSYAPTTALSIAPGTFAKVSVSFNPTEAGARRAYLRIQTNDPSLAQTDVMLGGQVTPSGTEPSLQGIMNSFGIPINIGDDNVATNVIHSDPAKQKAPLLGEEVPLQVFEKAGEGTVTIEPLAVFGPVEGDLTLRFGWHPAGNSNTKRELFTVPTSSGQKLRPSYNGTTAFDPGDASFGFYSIWPFFNNRVVYGEDGLNKFERAIPHHVRVYPYKNGSGQVEANTYVVAIEEHISGFDYQDLVFVVRNVKPVGSDPVDPVTPNRQYLPIIAR